MKKKLSKVFALASLALCFVVGGTFAACKGETGAKGDKGEAGAAGANGQSAFELWLTLEGNAGKTEEDFFNFLAGENGKDAVAPKLQINEETNEWEVSYDNGATWTSLGVKATGEKGEQGEQGEPGDDGEDLTACEHEGGFHVYELFEATCVKAGADIYVCKDDCGFAKVVVGEINPENHKDLVVEVVEPTCTEDGYTTLTCACDEYNGEKTEPTEKLGHDLVLTLPSCDADGHLDCARCDFEVLAPVEVEDEEAEDEEVEAVEAEEEEEEEVVVYTARLDYDFSEGEAEEPVYFYFEITAEELKAFGHTDFEDGYFYGVGGIDNDGDESIFAEIEELYGYVELSVVDPDANICEDGGQKLKVCTRCAMLSEVRAMLGYENAFDGIMVFESETIEPAGHVATSEWKITKAPTATEAGELKGYCDVCATNAVVVLPAVNAESIADGWYTKNNTSTNPTCTQNGKNVYDVTYNGYAITGKVEITTSSMHKFGTKEIDLEKIYTVDEATEIFGTELQVFGNAPAACNKLGSAGFTCAECNTDYLIKLSGNHEYKKNAETGVVEIVEKQDPTCCEAGYKTYFCTVCEQNITETVAKLPHDYEVSASEPDEDDNITLTFTCSACNACECEDAVYTVLAKTWTISEDPTKTFAANCEKAGQITYVYTYGEDNATGEFVKVLPKLNHYYAREIETVNTIFQIDQTKVWQIAELSAIYGIDLSNAENKALWEAAGFTMYGNSPASCNDSGQVSFTCSCCNAQFLIEMIGNHEWEAVEGSEVPPTCTTGTKTTYHCDVCDKDEVREADDELGHNPVCVSTEEQLDAGVLVFKCDREGCDLTYTVTAVWHEFAFAPNKTPTCDDKGVQVLYYRETEESDVKTLVIGEVGTTQHWIGLDNEGNRVYIDLDKVYAIGELEELFAKAGKVVDLEDRSEPNLAALKAAGITVFGNAMATCLDHGKVGFTCAHCEVDQLINDVTGNCNYPAVKPEDITAPTCTTGGYTTRTCTVCNTTVQTDKQDALGHAFNGKFEVVEVPTATKEGKAVITCETCEEEFTAVMPKITANNLYEGWWEETPEANVYYRTSHTEGTCEGEGKTKYYVILTFVTDNGQDPTYGGSFTVVNEQTDHDFEVIEGQGPIELTWEKDGYKYTGYVCADCGHVIVQSVEELPETDVEEEEAA